MKKLYLLFAALAVLCAAPGLWAATVRIDTVDDLLALNDGKYTVGKSDTVEFAAGKTFDLTGTKWKGIGINRGVIRGNGATVILNGFKPCRNSGLQQYHFGFVLENYGEITDLNFNVASDISVAEQDDTTLGALVCTCNRQSGRIANCYVEGNNHRVKAWCDDLGAITAQNLGAVSRCSVLNLDFRSGHADNLGLIAGYSGSTIEYCRVDSGLMQSADHIGAIAGSVTGAVRNCWVMHVYLVAGKDTCHLGGIAGDANYAEISQCCVYHIGFDVPSLTVCGGFVGCASYTDLSDSYFYVWGIDEDMMGQLAGIGSFVTGTGNYIIEYLPAIGDGRNCSLGYEELPDESFTDGTLLGLLEGGEWFAGPEILPVPFNWNVPVTGVALDLHSVTLQTGETKRLNATVAPSDASNKELIWSSYDKTVVKVSSSGKLTAIAPGSTTVRVKTRDGGFIDKCKVKVVEPSVAVTGVTLNKTSAKVEKGKTITLKATIAPADATNQAVTWISYDTTIATVTSEGKVKSIAPGTTTIRVKTKDGGFTAKCKVTVTEPVVAVTGVALNKTVASVAKGKTFTLKAVVTPTNATNQNVTWSSYDTSIATVTSEGKVKGIAPGTTTIKVKTKDGGFTAKCKVTVVIPVTGVTLDATKVTLKVGKTKTLKATVKPSDATVTKVVWTSSNPAVAKVNSSGKITAVKKGKATITATTADGGFTATCAVTVTE